jgi:hypothetical protein
MVGACFFFTSYFFIFDRAHRFFFLFYSSA